MKLLLMSFLLLVILACRNYRHPSVCGFRNEEFQSKSESLSAATGASTHRTQSVNVHRRGR